MRRPDPAHARRLCWGWSAAGQGNTPPATPARRARDAGAKRTYRQTPERATTRTKGTRGVRRDRRNARSGGRSDRWFELVVAVVELGRAHDADERREHDDRTRDLD